MIKFNHLEVAVPPTVSHLENVYTRNFVRRVVLWDTPRPGLRHLAAISRLIQVCASTQNRTFRVPTFERPCWRAQSSGEGVGQRVVITDASSVHPAILARNG